MKYWLLTTEYPPFHGGGISTYAGFTTAMLARKDIEVTVFVPDDGITDYSVSKVPGNITVVRFNHGRNQLNQTLGYSALLSYAFADIVRLFISEKGKPDYIEAQDYLGIAYYLTQFKHTGYAFMQDVPVIITLHSPAFLYLEYNRVSTYRFPDFWTCEMEKQSIRAADMLISPTQFLPAAISGYMDISDKKVHVLPNPYIADNNLPQRRFTRNRIVYYGKLSPQKGSFELLSYFKELWDKGFEHALHIIGGTDIVYHPEMQTMGQLVHKRYANYIKKGLLQMHGKIDPSVIGEYLQDAHVIVVPSIVDNLPYVVMEAMHLGKVVLASRQGGQREMVEEGITGFLFDHGEPQSFENQLQRVLALDDEAIYRIGLQANRHVQDAYSPDSIGERKLKLLQGLRPDPQESRRFPFLHQEPRKKELIRITGKPGLLSIVIPYYNMGKYIEECVQSVIHSTYSSLEIIIVDDGSTDQESIACLDNMLGRDNLRIVRQKNHGLADTRNYGAELASGEYLAFLDADDKVDPAYYEKAVVAIAKYDNVFFAGSWVQYFGNSNQLWPTFTPQPPYLLIHNPVNSSGLVYKRSAFLTGGLNDKRTDYGMEDYESVVNMLHHGFNGIVLPEVLFHYRVRSGSMFRNISVEKLLYSNKYIAEKHKDYYAKFAAELVNLLNANGPGYLFDNPTLEVKITSRVEREHFIVNKLKMLIKRNEKLKNIVLTIKKFKR